MECSPTNANVFLLQAVKFEPYHDSALARFLLKRGLRVSTFLVVAWHFRNYWELAGRPRASVTVMLTVLFLLSEQKNRSLLVLVPEKWDSPVTALSAEVRRDPGSLPEGLWHRHAAWLHPAGPSHWDATESYHWYQIALCRKVWRQLPRYGSCIFLVLFPDFFISNPVLLLPSPRQFVHS